MKQRYIFQVTGEAIVEANSFEDARRKQKCYDEFIEYQIQATSMPIPEQLLYSMDEMDEEETNGEE